MRSKTALIPASVSALLAFALLGPGSGSVSAQAARADAAEDTLAAIAGSGNRDAIWWGGLWGALQGVSLAVATDFGGGEPAAQDGVVEQRSESRRAVLGAAMVGGVVGLAGGILAARRGIKPQTARTAQMGSVWGTWVGLAASKIIGLDENPAMATIMAVGNAGLLGGAFVGSRWAPSEARLRHMGSAAMTSAYVGAGMVLIADVDDDRLTYGVGLASGIAGLLWGTFISGEPDAEEDGSRHANVSNSLPLGGSLLTRSRGEWSFSAPFPSPMPGRALGDHVRREGNRGPMAWQVPLLNVQFQ